MPRPLTERQRRFVDAYLVSRNAAQAARDAGYSPARAAMSGSEQLKKPHVAAALRARGLDPPRGIHPSTQIRAPRVHRPRSSLTYRGERFAMAYLVCGNATEAARRIGIRPDKAREVGFRLLHRPPVAAFIAAEREASIARTRIDADRVKRELARIAFVDIADVVAWDEDGNIVLKASEAISPDDRAAIAELKVKRGEHGVKARVKLHDKQRALDALAKMMGLFGKKNFITIDQTQETRDAKAELRARLLRIMNGEEEKDGEAKPRDEKEPATSER